VEDLLRMVAQLLLETSSKESLSPQTRKNPRKFHDAKLTQTSFLNQPFFWFLNRSGSAIMCWDALGLILETTNNRNETNKLAISKP
jgi:hypothetical protein